MKKESMSAVILAGGKSSRMGRPKDMLPWRGGSMLSELVRGVTANFLPCLIVSNHAEQLADAISQDEMVTIVPDAVPSAGPVSGLVTAFRSTTENVLLVLSCDLPFMDREQISRLVQYAAGVEDWDVVAVKEQGRLHPLCALYHRRAQPLFEHALQQQQLRLMSVLSELRVHETPAGLLDPWAVFNANTPEEYQLAIEEERKRSESSYPFS
jgi:molybdenum cofactor guanylyltransferase